VKSFEHLTALSVDLLRSALERVTAEPSAANPNFEALYNEVLYALIESLLDRMGTYCCRSAMHTDYHFGDFFRNHGAHLGSMRPPQIGELYEWLRGFKLETKEGKRPTLVPCVRRKRNEGLFYTPSAIVSHIVSTTLDVLQVEDPEQYLSLKILDPAAGTGKFLAEMMVQLTERVLAAAATKSGPVRDRVGILKELLRVRAVENGVNVEPDAAAAVRVHILEHCLFGVDIDPVAVRITRAVLRDRALPGISEIMCNTGNIRTGNALVGNGPHAPTLELFHHIWADREKKPFHWDMEFPEVIRDAGGFDAVVGNPPYEILSVKESGIGERAAEQKYFRRMYRSCQGKVNTYRLMLERGLELLAKDGALGFIVPATLLADSSAGKLRRLILDGFHVHQLLVIPEKAHIFKDVTQALAILVAKNSGPTQTLNTTLWDGKTAIPENGVEVTRNFLRSIDFRIPVLRTEEDKKLLEALAEHPPLGGNKEHAAMGAVHQGEINLTIHRRFITSRNTGYPLIRGEHVSPLMVVHPSPKGDRLDWVLPDFLENPGQNTKQPSVSHDASPSRGRGTPWTTSRIVLGRVVNMDSDRRLKAAIAPAGAFLGDMTNFIVGPELPVPYLLGLLNSRLLNRRIKLTSTNNYISAAEVSSLPVPRPPEHSVSMSAYARETLAPFREDTGTSVAGCVDAIRAVLDAGAGGRIRALCAMIEVVAQEILNRLSSSTPMRGGYSWNLLDALVLLIYGVEFYAPVLDWEHQKR